LSEAVAGEHWIVKTTDPTTEIAEPVPWSGDVEWLTISDVGWQCLRLVYSSWPGTREPCTADSDALWLPVCIGCIL